MASQSRSASNTLRSIQARMGRATRSMHSASKEARWLGPEWTGVANDLMQVADKIDALLKHSQEQVRRLKAEGKL